MNISGIYHSPATIIESASSTFATVEVARFAPFQVHSQSTATVINIFDSRQQMVWFMPFAPDWSPTSAYLSHAWVHWLTRGFYLRFRRTYFSTQVDDMFLLTDMYLPTGTTYRIDTGSLTEHITWMASINSRLPSGSKYVIEIGHNGNGNIEAATDVNNNRACDPDTGIEYRDQPDDVNLEFQKPLSTGSSTWPTNPDEYTWSLECSRLDLLRVWWMLNSFLSHIPYLRVSDATPTTIKGRTARYSLLQSWVEIVLSEMIRLVDWPFITLKHDDLGQAWIARMNRDMCIPNMSYTLSADRKSIMG
jgi:hypothetical protein